MRGSLFVPAVLAEGLPPMRLNGLTTSGIGTGPGWADDGTLSPEEQKGIGEAISQIGKAVGGVLAPKPPKEEKPPPPWGPILLGAGALVLVFVFVRRK